jgi:hypothetical protein
LNIHIFLVYRSRSRRQKSRLGGGTVFGVHIPNIASDINISSSTISFNGSNGVFFYTDTGETVNNLTIQNTTANDNGGSGFTLNGPGSTITTILTNITSSGNNHDGVNLKGGWRDVDISNCTIQMNGVDGVDGDGDGISFHDSTTGSIRYCSIRNNIKSGVAQVGDSDLTMAYNIFSHDTNGVIALVYLEGTGTYNLYNNVIYSAAQTGNGLQVNTGTTATIKNNIVYGFDKGIYNNGGTVTEDYNLVYNAGTSNWSGLSQGSYSMSADPLFLSAGSANFRLAKSSPAIDNGTDVSLTSDYAGTFVPQGSAPDIGAYEYIPLTVTINQAGGQSDPTNSSAINFTVVFSESVSDFVTGDVTLSGTAGATTAIVTGSGTTYNVAVTGMTGSGTVIASIDVDKATGATSNTNNASTSTDNTVTILPTPTNTPTPTSTGYEPQKLYHHLV